MSKSDDVKSALKRWNAFLYRRRKDVPRLYQDRSDDELLELLRHTEQRLALLKRLDQSSVDRHPEARSVRAMSQAQRAELRRETLAAGTRIRAELRRRKAFPPE